MGNEVVNANLVSLGDVTLQLNGVSILSDVSFEINPGEAVGLVGANGAGKSSVANVICGYYRPSAGTVLFEGRNLAGQSSSQIAGMGVRRSFQSVSYLNGLSMCEFVMLGGEPAWPTGLRDSYLRSARSRRVEERTELEALNLLEKVGLNEFAQRRIETCPYGARKFADVARAFMASPSKLVILDEPTSGVGKSERERLVSIINGLDEASSVESLLIVDHDVGFIRTLCKRVIVMEEGRILADGDCDEVLGDPRVIASFVGKVHGRE